MLLIVVSTPSVEEKFWGQLGLAVKVHNAAWLDTAEGER